MATLLEALHDDAWLLAIAKPPGLLTHRTLLDAHDTTSAHEQAEAQWGARLWPAHRLDKGTSGVLLFARDAETAKRLGEAFAGGAVHKRYRAWVRGWLAAETGSVDHPLARDPERPSAGQAQLDARTDWAVLQRLEWPVRTHPDFATTRSSVLALWPHQGRRHQLRRHCKHLGHPIVGDATHGKGPLNRTLAAAVGLQRLWLHAEALALPHPHTGEPLTLNAPLGPEWARLDQPSRKAAAVAANSA
jgi:tRNA pseudouridine65 synthase